MEKNDYLNYDWSLFEELSKSKEAIIEEKLKENNYLNYDWADTSWFEELLKPKKTKTKKLKTYDNNLLSKIYAKNIVWEFEDAPREHCKNGMCYEYKDPSNNGTYDFGPGINEVIWNKYGLKHGLQYSEKFLTDIAQQEAKEILDQIDYYIPNLSPKKKLIMLDIKYQTGDGLRSKFPKLTNLFVNESHDTMEDYDDKVKKEFATYDKHGNLIVRRLKGKELIWDWDGDLEDIDLTKLDLYIEN